MSAGVRVQMGLGSSFASREVKIPTEGSHKVSELLGDTIAKVLHLILHNNEEIKNVPTEKVLCMALLSWRKNTIPCEELSFRADRAMTFLDQEFSHQRALEKLRRVENVERPYRKTSDPNVRLSDRTDQSLEELKNHSAYSFPVSYRIRKAFHALHIQTVGDILEHSREEFMKVGNFGNTSWEELTFQLAGLGIIWDGKVQ